MKKHVEVGLFSNIFIASCVWTSGKASDTLCLMKQGLPEKKLQKAVDILEQTMLTLKFYVGTRDLKYLDELEQKVRKLHDLLVKNGGRS